MMGYQFQGVELCRIVVCTGEPCVGSGDHMLDGTDESMLTIGVGL